MGQLTHEQIVTEAMELAGNTGLTARAQIWLGLILRELFEKFPFPMLLGGDMSIGLTPQTLTAGSAVFGATTGSSGTTPQVRSVRRAWISSVGDTDFTELVVEHATGMGTPPASYPGSNLPVGRPMRVVATNTRVSGGSGVGQVLLYFSPKPDKNYSVWLLSEGMDLADATYTNGMVNKYPNDLTVIQGVMALALKHQQDERYAAEWAEFQRMAREDRVRYAQMSGANTKLKLKPGVFGSQGNKKPWDWMGPV